MTGNHFFSPPQVNDFFNEIAMLPHQSEHEFPVYNYIIREARRFAENSPEPLTIVTPVLDETAWANASPGERVIILRRAASSPEMEKKAKVVLQGHVDMVYFPSGKEVTEIPIGPVYRDEGLKADVLKRGGADIQNGYTLGADNGVGVAAALAIITDQSGSLLPRNHGVVECVFTVQEETNLAGAQEFDFSLLTGDTLLNLDSEDVKLITYGSAGGSHVVYRFRPAPEAIAPGETVLEILLSGLTGGHSGMNIHQGGANAVKIAAGLCRRLSETAGFTPHIAGFKAGDADNIIPNSFTLHISGEMDQPSAIMEHCRNYLESQKQLYSQTDPGMTWTIKPADISGARLGAAASRIFTDLLCAIPTGVLRMFTEPADKVETSTNLAMVQYHPAEHNGTVIITCSNRSASDQNLTLVESFHRDVAALCGLHICVNTGFLDSANVLTDQEALEKMEKEGMLIIDNRYPGWTPNENSRLLKLAMDVYRKQFPDIPDNKLKDVIHAGLECGWFIRRSAEAGRSFDCIAIGPSIHDPHSYNERLETETVPLFMEMIREILVSLWS